MPTFRHYTIHLSTKRKDPQRAIVYVRLKAGGREHLYFEGPAGDALRAVRQSLSALGLNFAEHHSIVRMTEAEHIATAPKTRERARYRGEDGFFA